MIHPLLPSIIAFLTLLMTDISSAIDFPAITTAPPPYFKGWYIGASETLSEVDCQRSHTYQTDNGIGQCCPGARCNFGNSCSQNVLYYDTGPYACSDHGKGYSCVEVTIFETYPTGSSVLNYFCTTDYSAFTVYRSFPASTTLSSAETISTSVTSTPTTLATATAIASETASQAASTTTDSTNSSASGSSDSKAWIAGAVVGPIAAIALVFLGFWYARRRKQQNLKNQNDVAPLAKGSQTPKELEDTSIPHELPPTPSHSELQARSPGWYWD